MKKHLLLLFCLIGSIQAFASGSKSCAISNRGWHWNQNCIGCYYTDGCTPVVATDNDNNRCSIEKGLGSCPLTGYLRTPNNPNKVFFNLRERTPVTGSTVQTRSSLMTPISITNADMQSLFTAGKKHTEYFFKSGTHFDMNIGIADNINPQTWSIPSSLEDSIETVSIEHFIAPSEVTPAAAQEPDATHVSKYYMVDDAGNELIRYSHYEIGTDADDDIYDLGSTYVDNTNHVVDYGEAAQIFADVPLDLNDNFTTIETEYDDDDELPKTVYTRHVVVDGFGTITNPFGSGTYDCLRMSVSVTEELYTTDPNTPSSIDTYYYVGWIARNGFRFFVETPAANSSGIVTLDGDFEMYRVTSEAVLDVELLDFQGVTKDKGVELTWTTANENNNKGFDIERSTDGKQFEKIGFVKGNGTTRVHQSYTFTDEKPLLKTTYYRLQQVDFDESKVSSNIIAIEPKAYGKSLKIYPNPTNGNEITLELPENTEGVEIINSLGQTIFSKKTTNIQTLTVDINQWSQGLYFIKSGREMTKLIKSN